MALRAVRLAAAGRLPTSLINASVSRTARSLSLSRQQRRLVGRETKKLLSGNVRSAARVSRAVRKTFASRPTSRALSISRSAAPATARLVARVRQLFLKGFEAFEQRLKGGTQSKKSGSGAAAESEKAAAESAKKVPPNSKSGSNGKKNNKSTEETTSKQEKNPFEGFFGGGKGDKRGGFRMGGSNGKGGGSGSGGKPEGPSRDDWVGLLAMTAAVGAAGLFLFPRENAGMGREVTWQEFQNEYLARGLVQRVTVVNKSTAVADLGQSDDNWTTASNEKRVHFTVATVDRFERKMDRVQKEMGLHGGSFVPISYEDTTQWSSVLWRLAPTALLVLFWLYMMRGGGMGSMGGMGGGGGGGLFNIGKAKPFKGSNQKVTFADVAGCAEAKAEIMEFVSFLQNPERFSRLGAKIPKGALLVGPPRYR